MSPYLTCYNPQWSQWFSDEQMLIYQTLHIPMHLKHIGSTSIKGLWAKPCIDMLGEISDFSASLIDDLSALGYEYRGEYGIAGRHYFSKKAAKLFHLHVFAKGHCAIQAHLDYLNVMNKYPALVGLVSQIKQQIFREYPYDKSAYQQKKAFVYRKIAKIAQQNSFKISDWHDL